MIQIKFQENSAASKSLNGATTGTGTTLAMSDCRQVIWQAEVTGTPSAGVAVCESNVIAADYAGQWENRDSFDVTNPVLNVAGVGPQGTFPGPLPFIRWRITTLFVGGTFVGHINGMRL